MTPPIYFLDSMYRSTNPRFATYIQSGSRIVFKNRDNRDNRGQETPRTTTIRVENLLQFFSTREVIWDLAQKEKQKEWTIVNIGIQCIAPHFLCSINLPLCSAIYSRIRRALD